MIPRIIKLDEPMFGTGRGRYLVTGWIDGGRYGDDVCDTFADAVRYWLYHCNVSPRICFWIPSWKREKYYWED